MQEIEDRITLLERQLNHHLHSASAALEELSTQRHAVTDPGMKRRGWGMDDEFAEFFRMAETVLYDIRCHVTEFGGGVTNEQQNRLKRLLAVVK